MLRKRPEGLKRCQAKFLRALNETLFKLPKAQWLSINDKSAISAYTCEFVELVYEYIQNQ